MREFMLDRRRVNGLVKSMREVSITIAISQSTGTATLTPAVDPNHTLLFLLGHQTTYNVGGGTDFVTAQARAVLTSGTAVTATRGNADGTYTATIRLTVLEFWPGVLKSVQYGTVAGGSTATLTTPVDVTRASAIWLGRSGSNDILSNNFHSVTLTDKTTVTSNGAGAGTDAFCVAEWH